MEDMIQLLKFAVIGLVQGFTEPIPVSSSGHVMIASEILGMGEQGFTFAILTNTASLLAILYIYRGDLIRLLSNFFAYLRTKEQRYKADYQFCWYIVAASIPAGVGGILLSDFIADAASMTTIAIMLFVTGIALYIIRNRRGSKNDADMTMKDAWIVGLGQAIALTPGISRSGATIITGIARGLSQVTAMRFSFMLYIPVSLGSIVIGISDFMDEPNKVDLALPYTVAFIATMIMTYFAFKWFMGIMKSGKLVYFTYYCFIVGTILLVAY